MSQLKPARLRLVARPKSTGETSVGAHSPFCRATLGLLSSTMNDDLFSHQNHTGFMLLSCRDSAVPLAPE